MSEEGIQGLCYMYGLERLNRRRGMDTRDDTDRAWAYTVEQVQHRIDVLVARELLRDYAVEDKYGPVMLDRMLDECAERYGLAVEWLADSEGEVVGVRLHRKLAQAVHYVASPADTVLPNGKEAGP